MGRTKSSPVPSVGGWMDMCLYTNAGERGHLEMLLQWGIRSQGFLYVKNEREREREREERHGIRLIMTQRKKRKKMGKCVIVGCELVCVWCRSSCIIWKLPFTHFESSGTVWPTLSYVPQGKNVLAMSGFCHVFKYIKTLVKILLNLNFINWGNKKPIYLFIKTIKKSY